MLNSLQLTATNQSQNVGGGGLAQHVWSAGVARELTLRLMSP